MKIDVQGMGEAEIMRAKSGYTVPVSKIIDFDGKILYTTDVAQGERILEEVHVYPLDKSIRKELGLKKLKKVI